MPLKLLLVTATKTEAEALRKMEGVRMTGENFSCGNCDISLLIAGVGSMATSWAMIKWISANHKPDLVINAGIAGSYRDDINIGDVVIPVSDCFADAGIETQNGFQTLAEAGFEDPDKFPFRAGKIIADNIYVALALKQLKPVNAITVNSATGSQITIDKLAGKFNPDIETMEGAAFFYICTGERLPFLAFRSVSNRVEPRNKNKWNIPLAIDNLSERLKDFILMID